MWRALAGQIQYNKLIKNFVMLPMGDYRLQNLQKDAYLYQYLAIAKSPSLANFNHKQEGDFNIIEPQ